MIDWEQPRLVAAYHDDQCGCPVEAWVFHGIELLIHEESDGSMELIADAGDWDQQFVLRATTIEAARAETFDWVRELPAEEDLRG